MEALLLILDCLGVVLICYMSMRDDRRKPGEAATSWFRYRGAKTDKEDVKVDDKEARLRKLQQKYAR